MGPRGRSNCKDGDGLVFTMLAKRAYGINAGTADDLSNFARMVMPAQEYGITFPSNKTEQ